MTRLVVEFDEWTLVGDVTVDAAGALVMPPVPRVPGIYRFWIETGPGRPRVYVGEKSNLAQRMGQYARPHPSQTTNVRVNAELRRLLSSGSKVSLWTVTEALAQLGSAEPTALDLDRKTSRLIVENAAVNAVRVEDLADVSEPEERAILLNLPGKGEPNWEEVVDNVDEDD